MLLIITPPDSFNDEVALLTEMALEPAVTIHLRKPGFCYQQLKDWLAAFPKDLHPKLMLHQHHQLANKFKVKGLHYSEQAKKQLPEVLSCYSSAAYHDVELASAQETFHYSLLSPVFDSISKSGLSGKNYTLKSWKRPVIALGGVQAFHIADCKQRGFQGVAVLGAIWKAPHPLKAFQTIVNTYKKVYGTTSL